MGLSKGGDRISVPSIGSGSVSNSLWDGVADGFVQKPLSDRGELSGEFDNFLGNDSSPEAGPGGQLSLGQKSNALS